NMNFATLPGAATSRVMGIKSYELTNHLGNVMSVITDRKIPFETSPGSGIIGHYASDIINHQDYYAFGANKPGRTYAVSAAYRYSFNGKEQDGETVGTSGSTQDYGMRIYNPSLGKFLSVDPLTKKYPELTPYQFASDRPIDGVDQDGLEWDQIFGTMASSSGYSPDAKDQEGVAKDFMGDFKETMKDPETYKGALRGSTPFLLAAMTLPFGGVGGGFIAEADATAVSASFEEAAINREMGTVGEGSAYDVVMSGYTPGNVGTPLGKTRLSNQQMIDMTNKHGVEFAQTYEFGPGENGGGGEYYLYSGNKNSVNLPVNKNTMLINHTHPLSTAKPSVYDVEYLQAAMKAGSPQKSSIIIPANASPPVRFNVKSEYMTVPSINYLSH
ncbi:MAG: RHS repeat-associated core domain-containing protein, partial [Mucilaginibacter sp.]